MRKQILSLVLVALFSVVSFVAKAQLSIAALATDYTISFDATVDGVNDGVYAGTGFLATPGSGQLDADAWAVSGMSDGEKPFGTENTTGDFGRGTSMANISGGLYAYEVEAANFAFGMLPGGSDITPGYIGLKVTNNTGSNANAFDFSYDVWVFNNNARSQFFNGEYSLDGTTWTPIAALAFATPLDADATPAWVKTSLTATISENITAGATLYLRWYTDDNGGSGSRDKISFDNVKVQMRGASYVDWCNIQSPDVLNIVQGSTGTVYGQVLKTGVTEAAGQGADITGYVYYSEDDTDPSTWTNFVNANYYQDATDNDEYSAELGSGLAHGTYYYATAFSFDGGPNKFGGYNGGFWDGTTNVSGELHVAGLHISSPEVSGTVYHVGDVITVNWMSSHLTGNVRLAVDLNDGSGYFDVSPDIDIATGTYGIPIPADAGEATGASLKIYLVADNTINDVFATFDIEDLSAPEIESLNPLNSAVDVAINQNLVIVFNENIAIGTGNVYIRKYSDNSVVQTIDITSCSVLGDDLTIDPADLEYSTQYYVEMDNTCIDDLYANDFAGFTGNSVWSFTTEDAPCYNPTILTAINVTGTTADLGWTAGGTETSWDIEVGAPGFTPGTGTALFTYSGVTSNPYTATGLTQLTSYQFYVRAVCGAETSTWTGPNSFTTICSAISAFPYSESFEATTAPPACWTMYYGDATPVAGNLMTHSTSYAYVGTRSFRFSSLSNDAIYTEYLVTPELSISSAKDLSFWYRRYTSGTESFTVGTSTTGNNIATDFTWGSNVTNASITWQQYTASIPAGVKYIAIRYNSSYQYYLYIDKFELLEPPTCIVPTALASSSVTYNSATVSWTASTSNPANGYQIYYSTSSTAPDAATIPMATVGAGITTYNMTGLNANTLYYVWVRSDCGAGDYSTWAGSVSFTTLCAPVTSYPVNEPFTSYLPSTCWNEGDNGDLTAGPVTISATASSWIADGFLNVGTTGAAKINIDATGDNDWIISPELTIPATPAYRFTYSVGATQFGGTVAPTTAWEADDFVQVLVSTSGYTNWTELKLYGSTNVPSHLGQTDILDFSAYAGQTIRIAFRGVEGAANGSADIDFFTDNWVIEETPLCSAPTTLTASGITSSQANLGWTETGTSTTWDIEIGLTGFVPSGTPTYNDVTSNPYTVNGLSAVTGYSYYVRSDCGGSQSVWTGPFNFNTGQEPAVLTFTEGFEIWPNGWSVVNGTQANAWYVGTATANSGNQSAYISNDNGLTNAYTITTTSVVHMYRDIAIPATTFPITVKFNWRGQGEGVAYDRLRVYMVETSVTPVAGTELTSGQIGLTNYNLQPDWTLSSLELPAATYSGATWRLVFTWKNDISDGTQPPIAIDDIEVSLVTCPDPTALTASSLQTNQATLSWTENGTATSWDIELGADGFTPTGTPTQTGVTNPYIYTGLTEATAYDYYVRSDCGAGDYSAWVGPFGFNTLASCAEPTTLTAANITSSSADLGWTAVGGTTTWNVEVGAVGFIPGTGAEVVAITGTTNNPTSVNGLSAQTTYLFYVQSDCGGGQLSNWAGPFSFTTPCAAISAFPWTENFESITTPALPSCWSQNNANGDTDFWKTYTTYGVGGSKTAGLYTDGNAGNNNDYLILPAFQLTGNQWLKFYVRARSSSEPNDYKVLLSTTGTLPADFTVELKPLTTVSSTTMTEIEPINLSAYTGTVYIAIHVPSGGLDGYYIYFDNFTIEDMPSCLPMTGVTVNGFTETTAQISWTASASNPADGYDIYYSTSSTAPDAGTTPNLNVGAGETSVEITGLTASSTYYVWVRSDCGGGDYSTWSNAVSFYTGYCIPAPTSQDGFGITNVTFGQTVVVNNTTGSETGFYGNYSNMVGDGAQGTILNVSITYATGYTYGTKIWVDWNNDLDFVDAGEQMYFGLSTNSNPTTLAASFTIPLATPLGNYRMRIGGTDNDAGPSTPCYNSTFGTFEDYTLQVIEVPACLAPSGIAAVATGDATATVTWTASASLPADGYEIYFSELNVAPEETTPASGTVLAGVTSYDIAGLNPNTTYYVWVRSNCGAGEYSAWAGSVNFTTACVAIADYPYFEGFNQAQMPDCWSVNNVDADGYQWIPTTSYFYEGTHSVNVHWNTTANNDWLISPRFQITNPALVLDFYARSTSSSFLESFNVLVSTTGTSPADFSIVLDNIVDHQNAWVKHSYQLSDYGINPGDEIYIAIQCVSVDGFYLAVDAFSIREPNTGTDILTYSIPEQIEPATIDSDNHVIDLTVGFGTDLTGLISTFTLSNGASAAVGATAQQSGVTPNDFTSGSVIYTVTAEDGTTTQNWTVNVTVADVNHDTDILTFGFDEQTAPATIDAVNHSIAVNINWWSNISSLIADFTLSYGATATIEGVAQTSGVTVNDFLHTVIYNVMAEDGTTNQNWEVNVTQDPVPQGTTCNTAIPYTINDPDFMGYMPAQHQYYFLVTLPEDYINVRMMTCGSSIDTKLAYFVSCDNVPDLSTCPSNPAGAIGYVDDGGCGTQSYGGNSYASYLNIGNLSAGTYLVAVYGYSTTDQGDVQFRVLGDEIPVADLSVNVESGYTCPVAEFYVPVEILNSGETTVAAGEVVNFVLESGGNVLINENFTITADLAPGASEMFTTINSVDLSDAGSYDWTATINWVSDMVDANDVISGNMVSFEQSIEFVDAVNDTITVTEFPYTITANAVLTPDVPLTTEYLWNSGTITNTEIVNAEGWNYLTITTLTCTYYDSVFVQYVLPVRDLAVEFGSGYTCPIEDINVGVTLVNEGNVIVTAGTTLQFVFVIDGTEVIDEELVFEEDLAPSESVTLFTVNTIDLLTTGVYAFSGTILWSDDSNSSNNVSSGEVTVFEHSINFVDADNDTITVDAWPYTITANATTNPVIPFNTDYLWEAGSTVNTLEVNQEGWYILTVQTVECQYTDSVYIEYFNSIPVVGESNISVYPNPTSGSVVVEFTMPESGNVTVQVMDALGRTLSEIKMSDIVTFNESIDLSGYAEGVYSIRFIFDNQSITKRVTLRK